MKGSLHCLRYTNLTSRDVCICIIIIYIYLFHPRYLHNDNFRYVTLNFMQLFHTVLCCYFTLYCATHYPCSYSNGPTFQFSGFLQLPSSSVPCSDRVRAAAKISAGGEGTLQPTFCCELPYLVLTTVVKISSVE